MNKEIIKKWNKYKNDLENYYRNNNQDNYDSYKKIIQNIFNLIINRDLHETYNTEDIFVIDNGDYQGTQIFILHKNTYQPCINDYIYTHTYYGSCSGCDTLLGINNYDDGKPSEEQVKEYMNLSLHLIQKMKIMGDSNE